MSSTTALKSTSVLKDITNAPNSDESGARISHIEDNKRKLSPVTEPSCDVLKKPRFEFSISGHSLPPASEIPHANATEKHTSTSIPETPSQPQNTNEASDMIQDHNITAHPSTDIPPSSRSHSATSCIHEQQRQSTYDASGSHGNETLRQQAISRRLAQTDATSSDSAGNLKIPMLTPRKLLKHLDAMDADPASGRYFSAPSPEFQRARIDRSMQGTAFEKKVPVDGEERGLMSCPEFSGTPSRDPLKSVSPFNRSRSILAFATPPRNSLFSALRDQNNPSNESPSNSFLFRPPPALDGTPGMLGITPLGKSPGSFLFSCSPSRGGLSASHALSATRPGGLLTPGGLFGSTPRLRGRSLSGPLPSRFDSNFSRDTPRNKENEDIACSLSTPRDMKTPTPRHLLWATPLQSHGDHGSALRPRNLNSAIASSIDAINTIDQFLAPTPESARR